MMIGIIDYDAGNIKSVEKALIHLGEKVILSRDPEILAKADKVILPGVEASATVWQIFTGSGWFPRSGNW